jgi:predicted short-subunit dehydrogenase-like oxidoreductase (DUF2520 family)
MQKKKISIIGSGNVANHLAQIFFEKKLSIVEIYSRNKVEGKKLADKINVAYTSDIKSVGSNSDIIIMAISDDAIPLVCKELDLNDQILAHTSGIANTEDLKIATKNYACFYPLQTFTKGHSVEFSNIPILINAANAKTLSELKTIAYKISDTVTEISDIERQKLHLSAVIVNNFTNHLFTLSSQYLSKNKIDFNLLKPLIQETVNKISNSKPEANQTGPAKRNDKKTIEKHFSLIEDEDLITIYKILTKSIYDTHNE